MHPHKRQLNLWSLWFVIGLVLWWWGVHSDIDNPWYWGAAILCPLFLSLISQGPPQRRRIKQSKSEPLNDSEIWRQRLQLVVDACFDGIWDWDIINNNVFWSDTVYKMTELDRGALGANFEVVRSMMHPEDRSTFDKEIRSHLLHAAPFQVEIRIKAPAWSDYRYFYIQGKARYDETHKPIQMAGSITNITSQKEYETQLYNQAYRDNLTGLGNRASFIEALLRTQQRLVDYQDTVFAIVLLDIDRFKAINDNYDHKTGDAVLQGLSKRLGQLVRAGDQIFRLGGDEFAILMNKIRNRGDVTRLASAIKNALEEPILVDNLSVYLTGCLGVVFSHEAKDAKENAHSESNLEILQQDAYLALYQAKQKGHGSIQVFSSSDFRDKVRTLMRNSYRLEQDLRRALERDQFYLVYQPIVNSITTKLVGFEVLLRWKHPELGSISPVNFIPIAEETGLICPIGEWILKCATEQFKKWSDQIPSLNFISVNVSAPQILQKQDLFLRFVQQCCDRSGLDPRYLKLELTESVAMKDVDHIIDSLNKLNAMGVRISLDDFGTGYSSLSYLKRFKIHTLKIDRAFVLDIPSDGNSIIGGKGTIVDTIIAMSNTLGLDIIAEGVETEEQAYYLRQRGVQYIQGFLYGRPMTATEVEQILEEGSMVEKGLEISA